MFPTPEGNNNNNNNDEGPGVIEWLGCNLLLDATESSATKDNKRSDPFYSRWFAPVQADPVFAETSNTINDEAQDAGILEWLATVSLFDETDSVWNASDDPAITTWVDELVGTSTKSDSVAVSSCCFSFHHNPAVPPTYSSFALPYRMFPRVLPCCRKQPLQ